MKTKEKEPELTPVRCACGKDAVVLVFRGKKNDKLSEPRKVCRKFENTVVWPQKRSHRSLEYDDRLIQIHRTVKTWL